MTSDDSLNRLLSALYSAPLIPEYWEIFLWELSKLTGVTRAALISHLLIEDDHRILASLGDSMVESVPSYESHYCQFDEWTRRFPRAGISGCIIQGQQIWPEDAMRTSVFYNEFLSKYDVCEMACIASIGSTRAFETLSIYRGPNEQPFDREQFALLQVLAPHLQTALATRRKLRDLECRVSDLESAFDGLRTALVLLNRNGKPVLANRAARLICDERDGLLMTSSGITAQRSTENVQLKAAILGAIQVSTGVRCEQSGARLISRRDRRPLQVLVAPLTSRDIDVPRQAVAVLFISDPDRQSSLPAAVLKQLYGLTKAETRLAIALLEGMSLGHAAELHQVGQETVRSQVKSIFQKTGTKRQGELVQLLASIAEL